MLLERLDAFPPHVSSCVRTNLWRHQGDRNLIYESDDGNTGVDDVPSAPESHDGEEDGYDEEQGSGEAQSPDGVSTAGNTGERKSAFYDYKQEKTLKDMDAKLFYHQQQHGQVHTPHSGAGGSYYSSPLIRAQTLPANAGNPLSRTASMKSFGSHQNQAQSPGLGRSAIPIGLASLDKPSGSDEVQAPGGMERFDPHRVTDRSVAGSYGQPSSLHAAQDQGFASSMFPRFSCSSGPGRICGTPNKVLYMARELRFYLASYFVPWNVFIPSRSLIISYMSIMMLPDLASAQFQCPVLVPLIALHALTLSTFYLPSSLTYGMKEMQQFRMSCPLFIQIFKKSLTFAISICASPSKNPLTTRRMSPHGMSIPPLLHLNGLRRGIATL